MAKEEIIEVKKSDMDKFLKRLAVLESAKEVTEDGSVDILIAEHVDHEVSLAVFIHEGKRYLFTDLQGKKTANGGTQLVYVSGFDQIKQKDILSVDVVCYEIDDNNQLTSGEKVIISKRYDHFYAIDIEPLRVNLPKSELKNVSKPVSLNRTVEKAEYVDTKSGIGGIQRQGTGVRAKLSYMDGTSYIETDFFGKSIIISQHAINLKH